MDVRKQVAMFDSTRLDLSVLRRSPGAQGQPSGRSLGCCRLIHRGIGPAFISDMETTHMAAKKKTAKKAAKKTAKKAKKK